MNEYNIWNLNHEKLYLLFHENGHLCIMSLYYAVKPCTYSCLTKNEKIPNMWIPRHIKIWEKKYDKTGRDVRRRIAGPNPTILMATIE